MTCGLKNYQRAILRHQYGKRTISQQSQKLGKELLLTHEQEVSVAAIVNSCSKIFLKKEPKSQNSPYQTMKKNNCGMQLFIARNWIKNKWVVAMTEKS